MTITNPNHLFNLTGVEHVTATVQTLNSTYVVIARKGWVKLILTDTSGYRDSWAPQVGDVMEGTVLLHAAMSDTGSGSGTTLHLIDADGHAVMRTSRVLGIDVHEN